MPKSSSKRLEEPKPNVLTVACGADETEAWALARMLLKPSVQAAATLVDYTRGIAGVSVNRLIEELGAQVKAAREGDPVDCRERGDVSSLA